MLAFVKRKPTGGSDLMAFRVVPINSDLISPKTPRIEDTVHLDFIRMLGCFKCQRPAQACHIRFASPKYDAHSGMQKKPHDAFTVPMCPGLHAHQHSMNEKAFWNEQGIPDPHAFALILHFVSPDLAAGRRIIREWT